MSEFSVTGDDQIATQPPMASGRLEKSNWWTRPIVIGLTAPWLAGAALLIGGAAWLLFAPEQQPSTNDLAFSNEMMPVESSRLMPAKEEYQVPVPQPEDTQIKAVDGLREYAEANRAGIERLAETVKAQSAKMAVLQQQLSEAQAQLSLVSSRVSKVESKPSDHPRRSPTPKAPATTPLDGMRLRSIQADMAWVFYEDKTWAVQVGDDIGPVTITGIDAISRSVATSGGTLK